VGARSLARRSRPADRVAHIDARAREAARLTERRRLRVTGEHLDDRLVGFGNDDEPIGEFPAADPRYADFSETDIATVEAVWRYTVTTPERIYALIRAVEYLAVNGIDGDIVECGVWRGGSIMVVARTLLALGHADRVLWLYDTFAGMTAPGPEDVDVNGTPALEEFTRRRISGHSSTWAAADLADVQANLHATGYPVANLRFIEGPVERTIPSVVPDAVSLLRLDTDWYASTRHELEHLYSRLVNGGVLIIDDYGQWRGAAQATDEFLAREQVRPLIHRIDSSARILVKP
jgi:O-methyltransferase